MTVEHTQPDIPDKLPAATLRRIRFLGHISLAGTLAVFVGAYLLWGKPYSEVGKLILAHIFGGRAGNATVGLNSGFSPGFILFQACMQDFIIMFYAFPFIVTGLTAAEKWPVVGPALAHIHELAMRHKARLAPYGLVGLTLFVIFPIWTTGPLVGVVVGYLLGLGIVFSFVAVMVGNTIAAALWIWAFDYINEKLLLLNENLPWLLMGAILIASIVGGGLHRWQKYREAKRSSRDAAEKKSRVPQPE